MNKVLNIFLIIHSVISFLIFLWLFGSIFMVYYKFHRVIDISIILEAKEKKYIEYYPKILFSQKNEDIPKKEFIFKNYEFFCHCNNNTNFRVYDKYKCLTLKECNSNFQTYKDNYESTNIFIWNGQKIKNYKQKYILSQGIKKSTGECDNMFKYKKCGFLVDLNINFCIKENELCPFESKDTNFSLSNLTSEIIMLEEDKNIKIYNNIEIKDLLPDIYNKNNLSINYEIIDYTNIYKLIFDNNIPYLKEIIRPSSNNIKIELGLLKIMNSDIKFDKNYLKETLIIFHKDSILDLTIVFFVIFTFLFTSVNIISFFLSQIAIKNKDEIKNGWKVYLYLLLSKLILGGLLIFIEFSLYNKFKSNLDKEYTFNDDYYSLLKSIKNNMINIFLIIPLSESNIIIIIMQILIRKFCSKKIHFVEIQ